MTGEIVAPLPAAPAPAPAGPITPVRSSGGVQRLILVELRRYAARAGVRWLVVGMLAVVAMTAFGAWRSSAPPSQAQLDEAQQVYRQQLADWQAHGQERVDACRQAQSDARVNDPAADLGCDALAAPTAERFLPGRTTFAVDASGWLEQLSTFLLLLALIVGATFVAAEFGTGAIATWLTFEPRRGRVFASKAVVATVATGAIVLVVSAVAVGALWLACALRGSVGDMTPEAWSGLGDQAGRLAAAGAFAAAAGAALAFLLRHTAATLGVVVGWMVAVDGILATLLAGLRRWTVQINLVAWLQGGVQQDVGVTSCVSDSSGTTCNGTHLVVSMAQGGLVLLGVLVVVTAVAVLVFRRRDVA